jgi:dipeptidyl aminopeptidase/acylaminoacyl peptidase
MTVNDTPTTQHYLMRSDGTGERVEIDSIPESWRPWHWPQWGGEAQSAMAAPLPSKPCRTIGVGDQTYDLFVQDCDGSNKRRLTVSRGFGSKSPSWSPDGQRIVFDGLFGQEVGQGGIYLINADGSNQTLFLTGGEGGFGNPAWSPDGERIAYMDGCNIKTIRLDGSDRVTVVKSTDLMNHAGDPEMCVYEVTWSPDSKRLAVWAWQLGESLPGPREERVAVVNADGTGLIDVAAFQMKEGNVTPYWSPDGGQVAYLVWEDNTARYYIVNADGSNQPVEIDPIPNSWSQSHWPQWDGEAQTTLPAPASQAEQARAFAEPILQAVADHKPDFEDDFSTADKGWGIGGETQEGSGIRDGVVRLKVKEGSATTGNTALGRKDFVLQLDARVAEGDKATQLIVNFHNLSSEYWFYVVVNSAGNTWLVDKHMPGDQRNLANGVGTVSPFGEATRIVIVAHGPRAAIYLNNAPVAYFEDADFDTSGGTGLFCQSLGQALCEFDNVRFWNLANVPGLP